MPSGRDARSAYWILRTLREEVRFLGTANQKHIFVINDDPVLLSVFRELLEDEGYKTTLDTFGLVSVDEQFQRILAARPDVIVLDFVIGGEMIGWQFLQMLKMRRETVKVPIVVCTAAVTIVRELQAHLAVMCIGVVLKPFDIDQLVSEIKKALDSSPEDPWHIAKVN
jgi:CheY-like chemotaxis protein